MIIKVEASTIIEADKADKVIFVKATKLGKDRKEDKKYYDNIKIPQLKDEEEEIPVSIASPQPLYFKNISPNTNDMLFMKMTYEGLKQLYLPFIAKLHIIEKSHVGGITCNHLEQLDKEFSFLTSVIDHEEAKILKADFFSRVADILYYKNSDLKYKRKTYRIKDNDDDKPKPSDDKAENSKNYSCTACLYYYKALSILLLGEKDIIPKNTISVIELLKKICESVKKDDNMNYNTKYNTVLAKILSDWGNVFYSCDKCTGHKKCYICDVEDFNTPEGFDINK